MKEPEELLEKTVREDNHTDIDNGRLTLGNIINSRAVQAIMTDFYQLIGISSAVVDIAGKVLVAVGWQDICTRFHRVHPETRKNCLESDLVLSSGVSCGEFKAYRCRNNLWDVATPIEIDGLHLGNIFLGQFFFDDEKPDYDLFREQARQYGFPETEYLSALDRVPRWSRETVQQAMRFYAKMAEMISFQGYVNYQLSLAVSQKDAALREMAVSRERQSLILQAAMDGFCIMDMQGRLLDVNAAYCRMSGYNHETLLSMGLSDLDVVETGEDIARHIRKIINQGDDRYESRHRRKDGSIFDVEVSVHYQAVDDGRLVAFIRDISERKKFEQEKATLETQLQKSQKLEAIGTLAGGIAHDFNNILFPIIGRCEMLLDDLADDDSLKPGIQSIMENANRAAGLVKQILAFSRQSEVGRMPLRIKQIVNEVLGLVRHSIPSTIELSLDIDKTCEAIMADAGQIHQVLMNLISNAYHAMEATGGKLVIGLKTIDIDRKNQVETGLTPGRYMDLYVSDTGSGIEQKIIGRIFDPYFTTKGTGKGTGLGLAVSYGIVKKHGGLIQVISSPGEGSIFHVYLPVMKTRFVEQAPEEKTVLRGGSEHILFVDDEYEIVASIVPMLKRLGYQVTARTGSVDALEDFRKDPEVFDLLITDMTMPNLTGIQLVAEIHKIRPDIPVILCTGFSHQINEDNAGQLGIKAFVMKPLVRDQLASLIRRILDDAGKT